MYAVAWHCSDVEIGPDMDVFPNVFPDFDMAQDCVIYEIKQNCGVELNSIVPTRELGGRYVYHYGDYTFIIRKLFNFNPRGL